MKKNLSKLLALLLVATMSLGLLAGCSSSSSSDTSSSSSSSASTDSAAADTSSDDQEVYNLVMSLHEPESAIQGTLMNWWCDLVEEKSEGRITFTRYWGGSYAGVTQNMDMLADGSLDVSWCATTVYSGRFPVCEVISLPGMGLESAVVGSAALQMLYENNDYMQEEFSDYYVVGFHTGGDLPISTTDTKIESIEDISKLQVRFASSALMAWWEAMGGSTISFAINDTYENLSKNVCNGVSNEVQALDATDCFEVIPYSMNDDTYRSFDVVAMCKETYESLPADLQAVIDECSGMTLSLKAGELWDESSATITEEAIAQGTEFYDAPDEVYEYFVSMYPVAWDFWTEKMDGLGYDAQSIIDDCLMYAEEATALYGQG